jgi:flagellar basal-body rod modification protein FlgD
VTTSIGGAGTQVQNQMSDTMGPNGGGTSAADLQQTFLQLLVTQLKNQDPTAPMDSSQMTSQLAQIDTVSGIAQLNSSLTSLSSQLSASQTGQAASLIGHTVLAPGNTFTVGNLTNSDGTASDTEATSPFGVQLAAAATDLQITVKNAQGVVVNTIDVGAAPAGVVPITS